MQMQPSKLKRGSMEEEEDRLSSLPNDLLHSILRALPLKHAVRTSVLSRRWAPQWLRALASSRVLDFTDPDLAELPPQDPATVRRCLELQAAPLDVLRVALRSPPPQASSSFRAFQRDVVGWIASAVARGAREVEVAVVVDDEDNENDAAAAFVELPGDLFVARNSLARLALCGFRLRAGAAPTTGLAGLRSLSLSHVDITGEVLRDVVSSCRSLEHLRLSNSECKLIWVASETLRVLEVIGCVGVRQVRVTAPALESVAFHETKFLWIWPDRSWDDVDDVFDFDADMPALREVYLSRIRYDHDGNTTNYESLLELEHVNHAPVWTISCQGYSLPLMLDTSNNIRELQLRIPREGVEDEHGLQGCFTDFFESLPLLDRLFVRLPGHVTDASDVDAAAAALAGEVVDDDDLGKPTVYELERLSFIKLVNFGGTRLELQLLAYFLKSAPALEHLVLVTVGEEGPAEAIQRHVSAMDKASPHARLTVCRPSQDRSHNPVHTRLYDQELSPRVRARLSTGA